jgi:hypothetical protein
MQSHTVITGTRGIISILSTNIEEEVSQFLFGFRTKQVLYYFWFKHQYRGGKMSQLIDRLKRVSGVAPQPIGFKVAREVLEKPRILVIASVMQDNLSNVVKGVAGADAVLCRIADSSSGADTVEEMCRTISGIPCGLWLNGAFSADLKKIAEDGGDFIVFPTSAPLAMLQESRIGKLLEVHSSMEVALLRAVNDLPVDAVLVSAEQGKEATLTCEDLLFYTLCSGLLEKALLVSAPLNIAVEELQTLWEAGISGVVVEIDDKASLKKMDALRTQIDKAVFPPRRKRRKMEATLPATGGIAEGMEEEEEEEE